MSRIHADCYNFSHSGAHGAVNGNTAGYFTYFATCQRRGGYAHRYFIRSLHIRHHWRTEGLRDQSRKRRSSHDGFSKTIQRPLESTVSMAPIRQLLVRCFRARTILFLECRHHSGRRHEGPRNGRHFRLHPEVPDITPRPHPISCSVVAA